MEKLIATMRERWLLIGSFAILTLLFWMLFSGGLALGFAPVWIAAVVLTEWYLRNAPGKKNSISATLALLCAVGFTPVYAICHHAGMVTVIFLVQGIALICRISLVTGHGGEHRKISNLASAAAHSFVALFEGLIELGECLSALSRRRRLEQAEKDPASTKRPFPWGIVGGILLALPAICILLPLLSSADAAFDGLMSGIESVILDLLDAIFENATELVIALVLAAICFYPVSGTLFVLRNRPQAPSTTLKTGIANTLLLGFYGSICLVCLAYLLSQLSYFFNGFLGILPEDMTAAEYARRGFFELFAVAMISIGLMTFGICLAREDRLKKVVSAMLIFLSAFNLLLISTALAKMALYMKLYGLTPKRLISSAIMIFLAVLFVILIIGRFVKNFRSLPVVLAAALIVMGTITYLDPDRIVAEYNVWAWENGKLSTIDVDYLGELSDAAVPALIRVYESEDQEASKAAERELTEIYLAKCYDYECHVGDLPVNDNIFAYNVTEHIANNALNEIWRDLPWEELQ